MEQRGRGGVRGGGQGTGGREDRNFQNKASKNQACELYVNHFRLSLYDVYAYLIDWGPNIKDEDKQLKSDAKKTSKEQLEKIFTNYIIMRNYQNNHDYLLSSQKSKDTEIEIKVLAGGMPTSITLTFRKTINLNNPIQEDSEYIQSVDDYLRRVMKRFLESQKYDQVGRLPKFFNIKDKVVLVPEQKNLFPDTINIWRGYEMNNFKASAGIFLNVDSCTKFLLGESILDQYKKLKGKEEQSKFINKFNSSKRKQGAIGETVLAGHNSKIYQVDQFLTNDNPRDHIIPDANISIEHYFQEKYSIKLDPNQPILMVNKFKEGEQPIYLPTQVSFTAQLPSIYTTNAKMARELAKNKITPEQRLNLIYKFVKTLNESKSIKSWGLGFEEDLHTVKAQIYNEPQIIDGKQIKPIKDYYFLKVRPSEQLSIRSDQVVFLYNDSKVEYEIAGWVQEKLKAAAPGLKMDFAQDQGDFNFYALKDNQQFLQDNTIDEQAKLKGRHMHTIMKEVPVKIAKQNEIVIVLLDDPTEKALVKRQLEKKGIVSQFLVVDTMNRIYGRDERTQNGAFSNILRQIQAKKKKDLYRLNMIDEIKNKNSTMFVGIDVVLKNGIKVIGLSASSSQQVTQHFSQVAYQDNKRREQNQTKDQLDQIICEERRGIVFSFIIDALKNWREINKDKGPSQIVVYRGAVGGPSQKNKCKVLESEEELKKAIKEFDPNFNPKILYILMNQNNITRFFKITNQIEKNPEPGTVVQTDIVNSDNDQLFDFYMVANKNPKAASARPVHYDVVINTSTLSKEQIIEITYHQCYNYYGFGGPIKTPATSFYAQRIAKYAVDNYVIEHNKKYDKIHDKLLNNLHFL